MASAHEVGFVDEVEVTATYYPGVPPRPWANGGEGDPGDPPELNDITVTIMGVEVPFDSLPKSLRAKIEDALTDS